MRGYYVGTSSLDAILINPSKTKVEKARKEATMRTRSGNLFRTLIGEYDKYKFNIDVFTRDNARIVNSWWATDTKLMVWPSRGLGLTLGNSGYSTHTTSGFVAGGLTVMMRITPAWDVDSITHGLWQSASGYFWGSAQYRHQLFKYIHNSILFRVCDASTIQQLGINIEGIISSGTQFVWAAGFDASALSHWANGSLVASAATIISSFESINSFFEIGRALGSTNGTTFHKFIAMNRLATDSEAYEFYSTGTISDRTSVVAEFDFDDNAIDTTGNNNHGTITGVDCWYQVSSVQLMNKSRPFADFVLPYIDRYRGVIELEGY